MLKEEDFRSDTIKEIAKSLATAARTAPKARGIDNLLISLVEEQEKIRIAEKMSEIAESGFRPKTFSRDAENTREADCVLLIGTKAGERGVDCGFCNFKDCEECRNKGGICAHNLIDLGIAIGSSVSRAADFRVDNRVMFTIGYAAKKMELLEGAQVIIGIPLSATGKSIFFDRK